MYLNIHAVLYNTLLKIFFKNLQKYQNKNSKEFLKIQNILNLKRELIKYPVIIIIYIFFQSVLLTEYSEFSI